jgi:LysM repeat protein
MFREKTLGAMLVLVCGLALCGCNPPGQGAADEEKEPQFLIGRSRVNAMNFAGAMEAFEQALEKNPQSAAAHFELGWLNAEKESDPAAAIYHYQKYLKLRPHSSNAETIKEHIFRLKQDLAKGVLPVPASNELQKQLEQVVEENRRLTSEVDRLKTGSATPALSVNRPVTNPQSARPSAPVQPAPQRAVAQTPPPGAPRPVATRVTTQRQHRILAGDTPSSIARRYDVRLESLLTANPSLNPHRLQVGQSLVIPAR